MADTKEKQNGGSLAFVTSSGLRGRQSVRATFKLSAGCIEAISIVAAQLGIKQKSLFDHLAQDSASLNAIAKEVRNARIRAQNRVQKTYVISRRSLTQLDEISRAFNAPRDVLVEYSVRRLLPVIDNEQKKYEMRKKAYTAMHKHLQSGKTIRSQCAWPRPWRLTPARPRPSRFSWSAPAASRISIRSISTRWRSISSVEHRQRTASLQPRPLLKVSAAPRARTPCSGAGRTRRC